MPSSCSCFRRSINAAPEAGCFTDPDCFTTATAGAPEKGTFTITATYADPPSDIIGFAEVYTRSPRDGTIDEIVRVPLILAAAR